MTATVEIKGESFDMDLIDKALEASDAEPKPYAVSMLEMIGTLRRDLARAESELEDAKELLQDTEEWDRLRVLKEERKALQKKLDRALDRTIHWAQPSLRF